jgi:hypothetical protein
LPTVENYHLAAAGKTRSRLVPFTAWVGWPNTERIKFDTWFCGSFGRPDGEQHAEPDSAPEQGG